MINLDVTAGPGPAAGLAYWTAPRAAFRLCWFRVSA